MRSVKGESIGHYFNNIRISRRNSLISTAMDMCVCVPGTHLRQLILKWTEMKWNEMKWQVEREHWSGGPHAKIADRACLPALTNDVSTAAGLRTLTIIKERSDKSYLADASAAGVPFLPTMFHMKKKSRNPTSKNQISTHFIMKSYVFISNFGLFL